MFWFGGSGQNKRKIQVDTQWRSFGQLPNFILVWKFGRLLRIHVEVQFWYPNIHSYIKNQEKATYFFKTMMGTSHLKICSDVQNRKGTQHIKMCWDVQNRVGTPHIKMCSDFQNRVGTPYIKMSSDIHTRVGTSHKNMFRCSK